MKDLTFTNNQKIELVYDILAGILAIVAVLIVMLQFSQSLTEEEMRMVLRIDNVIYVLFLIDYIFRLVISKDKKYFFKHNLIDLISILPYPLFYNTAIGRVIKILRVITYILRLISSIKEVLFTNGFIYALGATVLITVLGSIGIYVFESGVSQTIQDYGDALWWSFVTVTTVGYGDISPTTNAGRFIACILMLAGIGFLSMLTSTISTFFFNTLQNKKENIIEDKEVEFLDISRLTEENKKALISYYNYLNNQ